MSIVVVERCTESISVTIRIFVEHSYRALAGKTLAPPKGFSAKLAQTYCVPVLLICSLFWRNLNPLLRISIVKSELSFACVFGIKYNVAGFSGSLVESKTVQSFSTFDDLIKTKAGLCPV